jgi:group I intron endonuclease
LTRNIHPNNYLQHAWKKYGERKFIFWILEEIKNFEMLITREQFYLDLFQDFPFGLYNLCPTAGSLLGFKFSGESKRKVSEAQKGRTSAMKGRKHSEESIKKMSEAMMGNKNHLGFKHSEQSKKLMSENRKRVNRERTR